MKKIQYFWVIAGIFMRFFCNAQDFAYNLGAPSREVKLDKELEEISGLSMVRDGILACVEDEQGILYLIDISQKKIIQKIPFAKKGDYEGVEIWRNTAFVLRSDGNIYEIKNFTKNPKVKEYHTFLSKRNNTEGLCYDPESRSLWIVCKGEAYVKESHKKRKALYTFSISHKTLQTDPFLVIDWDDLNKFSSKKQHFNPSAVAIHPLSKDIYILASSGEIMVVMDRQGKIKAIQKLARSTFSQPEGICFDKTGTMYISNEGRGGRASILLFEYRK